MNSKIYYPLKDNWRIDEDKGFVEDQILERVQSESNYEWSRKPLPAPKNYGNYSLKMKDGKLQLTKDWK